ncbi:hypothetical protein [Nocardia nepalensis]|uniref:hypothetical protein n=1 Tax=Nocardia nepalensis TaxID=3375448 RepID=UPI003B681A65
MQRADLFAERYGTELSLVSGFCTQPAQVESTGGGCYTICGQLFNGLSVAASNGDMEGHDAPTWTLGLYSDGEQLGYLWAGTLAEQLDVAASLTAAQLQALTTRSPADATLPEQIVVI